MSNKKRALGRGLSALLEDTSTDVTSSGYDVEKPSVSGSVAGIKIEQIETNPFQPRSQFEQEALAELAASIAKHGIIQPVTVRKMGYDRYQLISGERRFRASQLAGLEEVPAYIRVANDQAMLEMALVENIQREELNAVEIAISYKRLIEECNLTQEALSDRVSKKRSTVTNYLRLLRLPAEIQLALTEKKLSMGHARALVGLDEESSQLQIFAFVLENNLSVRQTEEMVRTHTAQIAPGSRKRTTKSAAPLTENHTLSRDGLARLLNTPVDLKVNHAGSGKLSINFSSQQDLERIIRLIQS